MTRLASCFVAVSEHLHFGRAAEQLGMSQPALSQAIRQLETVLRCQLFIRSGSGVTLTRDGETALMRARTLIRPSRTSWPPAIERFRCSGSPTRFPKSLLLHSFNGCNQ
ncbi:LysR family transcriptional regulator [Kocuria atrinae]|uniref:LysR family transcriptional regulator n=1 Tax=Kocuria atrinae TaxID=592377 RepID=UPI0021D44CEB|nr:LysR family transcriptional regulator [Kocuria atrinae]